MKKEIIESEYEIHAKTFLHDAKIVFETRFLFHGPHWEGDKDFRDVYNIFFTRNGKEHKPLIIRFGNAIVNSRNYYRDTSKKAFGSPIVHIMPTSGHGGPDPFRFKPVKVTAPTSYDVIASITKNDPGSFENFCSDFGYDTDSRKAEKTYLAVQKEWNDVKSFFTGPEIEAMQEIN